MITPWINNPFDRSDEPEDEAIAVAEPDVPCWLCGEPCGPDAKHIIGRLFCSWVCVKEWAE